MPPGPKSIFQSPEYIAAGQDMLTWMLGLPDKNRAVPEEDQETENDAYGWIKACSGRGQAQRRLTRAPFSLGGSAREALI